MTNSKLIGTYFEDFFEEIFPKLKKIPEQFQKVNELPDFEHPNFYIETKASYQEPTFGAKIKESQIIMAQKLSKPTLYVLGFHSFTNSRSELSKCKTRNCKKRKIKKYMKIKLLYFVDFKIIENIWNTKNRIAKSDGTIYLNLRRTFLEQIINNSNLTGLNNVLSNDYYGFNQTPTCYDLINLPKQIITAKYIGNNIKVLEFLSKNNKLSINL